MVKVDSKIIQILKNGGVGILPTDTLYGLVGLALNKKAVERIYEVKKRSEKKPFIILISKVKDLKLFGVELGQKEKKIIKEDWPGPVSIILECPTLLTEMSYLRPLNSTLAFRMPKPKWLRKLLKKTGPLVAPTANPEGANPAENIAQAKAYFKDSKDSVDFYVDGGELKGQPSTLIALNEQGLEVRRQGSVQIKK